MKKKIWQNTWVLLLAVATVGPLAIPLVWKNPDYSSSKKWVWTFLILTLTIFLVWFSIWGIKAYLEWLQSKISEIQQLSAQ
jgi:quinol-cytochrome oxidoreductase complex cytochrome b subunit